MMTLKVEDTFLVTVMPEYSYTVTEKIQRMVRIINVASKVNQKDFVKIVK